MANRKLILAALLLILASLAQAQKKPCFKSDFPTSASLLKGDIYAIDLDLYSEGNRISFEVKSDQESESGYFLVSTFSPNREYTDLKNAVDTCTTYTSGKKENEYVFLCDDNKLSFQTLNPVNGAVENDVLVDLSADLVTCHAVRTSERNSKVFALCSKGTSLHLYAINPLQPEKTQPFVLEQPADLPAQQLSKNLRLLLDDYTQDAETDTILYVYEENAANPKPAFRLVQYKAGSFSSLGFFGKETDNTTGLKDGRLFNFYYDGSKVMVVTRDAQNRNTLQRCQRTPVNSKYVCEPEAVDLGVSTGIIKLYHIDPSLHLTNSLYVLTASINSLVVGIFDPETFKYSTSKTFDLTGSGLQTVNNVWLIGNNFFLVGPTKPDNPALIDGVVKVSRKLNSFETYNFDEAEASVALVRKDYYNSHHSDLIVVGKNTTSFYRIKKNILEFNTNSFESDISRNIKYTLKCTADNTAEQTIQITIQTQLKVNENPKLNLPDIDAFAGAISVHLPTNGDDITGNSPELRMLSNSSEANISFDYRHINGKPVKALYPAPKNLRSIKHIGEGIFYYKDDLSTVFFSCIRQENDDYECKDFSFKIDFSKERVLQATVISNVLVLLTTNRPEDGQKQETYIKAVTLQDGKNVIEPIKFDFASDIGEIKLLNEVIVAFVVGNPVGSSVQGFYYARFSLDEKNIPKQFTLISTLKPHICPKELAWTPRAQNFLYINSICDTSSLDNHVYEMVVDFDEPIKSEIVDTYVVLGSQQYNICAQTRLINIIDSKSNTIYSFDSNSGQDTKYNFPTAEYGITSIVGFTCDQENNMLQIIGCGGEGSKRFCNLITYRGDMIDFPNRRVHSVMTIPENIKYVASTFNDDNDQALTIMLNDKGEGLELYVVEIDGPHIRVIAQNVTQSGPIGLEWTVGFPTDKEENTVTLKKNQTINFELQPVVVNVSLIDIKNKPKLDGSAVNLEDYIFIQGPFHGLEKTESISNFDDRLTPSTHFSGVKAVFDDAIFHKDFIFGFAKNGSSYKIVLMNTTQELHTKFEVFKVINLQLVAKDDRIHFFAICRPEIGPDSIFTFYSLDGGANWKSTEAALDSRGFKTADIIQGPEDSFIFGGYNNLNQWSITTFIFDIDRENNIVSYGSFIQPFRDNIADFELITDKQNNVILIAAIEYEKQAYFYWMKAEKNGLKYYGVKKAELVPGVMETHSDISFKCQIIGNTTESVLCVNTGKNKFSYVTAYELNFKASNTDEFITSTKIQTKLRNIVNLKPLRIDFKDKFVAVMVSNKAPLVGDATATHNSFFNDSHLCLVYKIDSKLPTPPANVSPYIPERDVYKILSSSEFGVNSRATLSRLDPRFYTTKEGSLKLGVNIGTAEQSIKVFNLEGLTLTVRASTKSNSSLLIGFKSISNSTYRWNISELAAFDDYRRPESKTKLIFTIILIFAIILIITVVTVGVVLTRKSHLNTEDLNIDEVERSMKHNEDESGNYSKL